MPSRPFVNQMQDAPINLPLILPSFDRNVNFCALIPLPFALHIPPARCRGRQDFHTHLSAHYKTSRG